jgi:hypothetical protein
MSEFEVEAAYTASVTFNAEIAAIRTLIGYVQIKCVAQPINSLGLIVQSHIGFNTSTR